MLQGLAPPFAIYRRYSCHVDYSVTATRRPSIRTRRNDRRICAIPTREYYGPAVKVDEDVILHAIKTTFLLQGRMILGQITGCHRKWKLLVPSGLGPGAGS